MIGLLGASCTALAITFLVIALLEGWYDRQVAGKGQAGMQRNITVWVCEECVMIYHNEIHVCPDCEGAIEERTFATSSQLNVYLINTEIEQYRLVLQRRMPGMTITTDDAFYFHGFEHRNECTLFARCCEADPVATVRHPSPVDRETADRRRLQFVRWMRENRGAFSEFPED